MQIPTKEYSFTSCMSDNYLATNPLQFLIITCLQIASYLAVKTQKITHGFLGERPAGKTTDAIRKNLNFVLPPLCVFLAQLFVAFFLGFISAVASFIRYFTNDKSPTKMSRFSRRCTIRLFFSFFFVGLGTSLRFFFLGFLLCFILPLSSSVLFLFKHFVRRVLCATEVLA